MVIYRPKKEDGSTDMLPSEELLIITTQRPGSIRLLVE